MKISISYHINQISLPGITDRDTIHVYKTDSKRFEVWCKSHQLKLKAVQKDPQTVIQQYADSLTADGYSPASIHRFLAPVCKGFGVNMAEVNKPKRTADKITRSRDTGKNKCGDQQQGQERFARLVSFQTVTGIRRRELARLKGQDIGRDVFGRLYIIVERGKGGKVQQQYILPDDEQIVLDTFKGIEPEQKVFTDAEMRNKIDLHALRASHARECYKYYADLCQQPEERERLIQRLEQTFQGLHPEGQKLLSEAYKRFTEDMLGHGGKYTLRGSNKLAAINNGLPTEYDRVAMMCVSVWHLSHWRLDVTAVNYLTSGK